MSTGSLVARSVRDGSAVRLEWRDGLITALAPADRAPDDAWLAPMLFEAQVNGYGGISFWHDGPRSDLEGAIAQLRAIGCGQMLLTIGTNPWQPLVERLRRYRAWREESPLLARVIRGWHVEGPFISGVQGFVGAHNPAWTIDPTPAHMRELREAAGDLPMMLTMAPERPGSIESIREAVRLGMVVSLGHTNASRDDIAAAVAAGARSFTHLGNGIPQQLDRHDNLLWRVLDGPPLTIGVVTDGAHVAPMLFRLMHRLGVELWYTTDAVMLAGLPAGRYRMGDQDYDVGADYGVREPGRTNLSGSAMPPLQGVFRAARMLSRPWCEAWVRFSDVPRRMMGVSEPLAAGQPADFCVVRGSETEARSLAVFADGVEIKRHEPLPT